MLSDQPTLKLIQCRDVRHSRPVMEVFVAPGIGFGLWHSAPAAVAASIRRNLRWFWSFTVTGPMTRADRVATLEEAKAQFQKSWDAWKAWAKLEEAP